MTATVPDLGLVLRAASGMRLLRRYVFRAELFVLPAILLRVLGLCAPLASAGHQRGREATRDA